MLSYRVGQRPLQSALICGELMKGYSDQENHLTPRTPF